MFFLRPKGKKNKNFFFLQNIQKTFFFFTLDPKRVFLRPKGGILTKKTKKNKNFFFLTKHPKKIFFLSKRQEFKKV